MVSLVACPSTQSQLQASSGSNSRLPLAIVVQSRRSPFYKQVSTAFAISSRSRVKVLTLTSGGANLSDINRQIAALKPKLLFTLGPLATRLMQQGYPSLPSIFALVPRYKRHLRANALAQTMGITINKSIREQFQTIKTLAPKTRTIGVIYNPRHSRKVVMRARKIIAKMGMRLVAARVDSANDVPDAIRLFDGAIDALWQIADPSLKLSFKQLRRFSFRAKIPFFALTRKFVQSGALVSAALNYPDLGHQAAEMSNRVLFQGDRPSSIGIQSPRQLHISVNLTTARRLGVACNIALEVMDYASKKKFPLSIYP
jgi:putative ABC transport system substrate-binding protein